MYKYQYLKCPGHYVSIYFLRHYKKMRMNPSTLFRKAVIHQRDILRQWLEEELGTDKFSLDHHPVPFSALKHIFLKQQGINPDQLTRQLITTQLLKDWQHFHGVLAEYRVIDPAVNRRLGQRHFLYWHNQDIDEYRRTKTSPSHLIRRATT